ncbi:MAG: hypothetical protein IT515_15850 [Burkholderiales bacterium]|nr:hypothetical protein [Burkholderiales bacterium]
MKPDDAPDAIKGPGDPTRRHIREQAKKSAGRDPAARAKTANALASKQSRWQRAIRYVWDRGGSRGGRR